MSITEEIGAIEQRFEELDVECATGYCNIENNPDRQKLARRYNKLLTAIGDPRAVGPLLKKSASVGGFR